MSHKGSSSKDHEAGDDNAPTYIPKLPGGFPWVQAFPSHVGQARTGKQPLVPHLEITIGDKKGKGQGQGGKGKKGAPTQVKSISKGTGQRDSTN